MLLKHTACTVLAKYFYFKELSLNLLDEWYQHARILSERFIAVLSICEAKYLKRFHSSFKKKV